MRIYHFADLHFSEKDHDEVEKCMLFLINRSRKDKPDVFICSGDVLNSQYLGLDTRSSKTVARLFREMSDIAPVAVVIGTPSHEGLAPELLKQVSGKNPIHVSTKPEQIYLIPIETEYYGIRRTTDYLWADQETVIGREKNVSLVVTQIPAPTKEHWQNRQGAETDNQNIAQAMGSIFAGFGQAAKQFPNVPHILNGHFSMKGSKISETQTLPGTDIAIDMETLSMAQADLYCLGHVHMNQHYSIPGQGAKVFHSGSIYRKDFGEQGQEKGFYLHDICDTEEPDRHEFIQVPTREMVQINYDLIKKEELLNDNFIWQVVQDIIASPGTGKPGFWVKIKITLWIDDIRRINQSALKQGIIESGADNVILEINRVRRENSREETILRADLLVDKVRALAEHRCQPAPDGVFEMLEKVETLSADDLVKYAKNRLNPDKPVQIRKESDSVNENEREVA